METTRVFPDAITCKGSGIGVASYGGNWAHQFIGDALFFLEKIGSLLGR